MIYDKVKINNIDNSIIYNKVVQKFQDNYIKIIENEICDSERATLIIDIKNENIYIDNKIIDIDEIFKKYRLVANIYDKDENFIYNYAKMISKRKIKTENLLSKYKYYNNFDKLIGALYLSDEEYYLFEETRLKEFIFSKVGDSFKYVMPIENGYLLRGANTYYYLLSNKGKNEHVKFINFKELYYNYQEYFEGIIKFLNASDNKILVLSILDNIRNYMLTIINILSISKQEKDETILLEFDDENILDIVYDVYEQMVSILEDDKYNFEKIKVILRNAINIKILTLVNNISENLYDKMLKSHRECDNFLENYVCIKDHYNKSKGEKNYLSALYGGIEIPLIYYYLSSKKTKIYYISLYGIYKERHKKLLNYNDMLFKVKKIVSTDLKTCVLCDDNFMTGRTLQYIIDCLALENIAIKEIFIINYVALNRIYQMIDNISVIDLNLIDRYIFGLFYPTKYSKIKFNTNINNTYLDEFNLFDLSKEYICYFLYKNGLYTQNSRINKYKIEGGI